MKKGTALLLSLALAFSAAPQNVVPAVTGEAYYESEGDEIVDAVDPKQAVIDEAEALGVPNAFIMHQFAEKYEAGEFADPVVEGDGTESISEKISVVTSAAGVKGLQVKKVDTGILARTKFDLGEYDFGDELKSREMIYSMLADKKSKGKGYFYLDDEEEPFAELTIKRSGDDDWEETMKKAFTVSNMDLTGTHHIFFRYVANSALDTNNEIVNTSGKKASLFLEGVFFTEGSTPVVSFDLDNEVNSIDRINGSDVHSIMGYGDMTITIPEGYEAEYTDEELTTQTYELDYIRGRGNSTWLTSKKPYKIKLDKSSDLFGMGKSKHWVLLANYFDYSLVRNKMTTEIAERLNMEYTPKSVFVDVIINDEYCGSYQLSQHVRIGKGNINIDDLEDKPASTEPEITGGYLLAMDTSWLKGDEKPEIKAGGKYFYLDKPEYDSEYPEEAKEAQLEYLKNYIDKIAYLITGTDYSDYNYDGWDDDDYWDDAEDYYANKNVTEEETTEEETQEPVGDEEENQEEEREDWRDYMDEQSYIDYYLIQEISKNGDAYGGSTYLYKKRNGQLYWGPVWDFDFVAWGAYDTSCLNEVEGIDFIDYCPWLEEALEDPAFQDKVIERWNVMSEILKDIASEGGTLDQYKEKLYYSALANYQVRSSYLMDGVDYWWGGSFTNYDDEGNLYTLNYTNEINRLKSYVNAAANWMDENVEAFKDGGSGHHSHNYDVYPRIPFEIDGEVVAMVRYDDYNEEIVTDDIPEAPEKEGMVFRGWYYVDDDGDELKVGPYTFPYHYEYDSEADEYVTVPYTVYAKYVSEDDIIAIEDIKTVADKVYVPMWDMRNDTESYYFRDSYFESDGTYVADFISVIPFDADIDDVKISLAEDYGKSAEISKDGLLYLYRIGKYTVNYTYKDITKQITFIGVDKNDLVDYSEFTLASSVQLQEGEYGSVNFKFKERLVSCEDYSDVMFKSLNPDVVEVDDHGNLHAVGEGTAQIAVVRRYGDSFDLEMTTVTVGNGSNQEEESSTVAEETSSEDASSEATTAEATSTEETTTAQESTSEVESTTKAVEKPAKVSVKKASKKKSAKKISLKFKKVKDAKGYEVAVYKSKKAAKKNKDALYTKTVKKAKTSVKSKKFKNKKKLFVRIRAYVLDGETKVYGSWSKVKAVKIKK